MFSKIDEFIDGILKSGVPFCDMAIYHKGKEVYRRTEGALDMEGLVSARGDEMYNVYSASKLITCTAALMLSERGVISLDDKLAKYMPEFEKMTVKCDTGIYEAKNSITIRHLFTMTAGLNYDIHSPSMKSFRRETGGECPTSLLAKYISREPLSFEPGERWQYGLCHDILAALVEKVSGDRFGAFAENNIFRPLGMKNTTFSHTDDLVDSLAPQYLYSPEKAAPVPCSKKNVFNIGALYESGGAGCISTLEDYIKFLEGLRCGKLISDTTLALMAKNHIEDVNRDGYWLDGAGYGYGLGVRCPRDCTKSDFGWGGAAGAVLMIDTEHELTALYIQHVLSSPVQPHESTLGAMISGIFA